MVCMTGKEKHGDVTAERIQAFRLKAGRSEQELADELGITVHSYRDLEQHDEEIEDLPDRLEQVPRV